jgi:hypothetical protein
MTMQRLVGISLLGIALALPGCDERRISEPKDEYFERGAVSIIDKTYDSNLGRELYIIDCDNDGKADIIHFIGHSFWTAPGYEDRLQSDSSTLVMTPAIREAATKEMHAERDLAKLLAKEAYRIDQKKHGGQK